MREREANANRSVMVSLELKARQTEIGRASCRERV